MKKIRTFSGALAILLFVVQQTPAQSQDSTRAPQDSSLIDEYYIEDVLVTTNKRKEKQFQRISRKVNSLHC